MPEWFVAIIQSNLLLNMICSVVVAVITAKLTAHFTAKNTEYKLSKQYELDYKKILMSEKVRATEEIYAFLRHFDQVSDSDGYYGCMIRVDEMDKLLNKLNQIDEKLIWFSSEFDDKMVELYNELMSYRKFMDTSSFQETSPEVLMHKDAFADMVRIDAIQIRSLLYEEVLQKNDVLKKMKQSKERLRSIPYLRDREKYNSIWFDGKYANKHVKRYR